MSFRNEYKNLWEKSDKELEEIIKIKLKMISEGIYFDILKNWRRKPVKSTIGDPNTFDLRFFQGGFQSILGPLARL